LHIGVKVKLPLCRLDLVESFIRCILLLLCRVSEKSERGAGRIDHARGRNRRPLLCDELRELHSLLTGILTTRRAD
jgi:hypothetical protein